MLILVDGRLSTHCSPSHSRKADVEPGISVDSGTRTQLDRWSAFTRSSG
jgi:hypothetical protein